MHFFKTILTTAMMMGAFLAIAAPAPEPFPDEAGAPELESRVVTPAPDGQAIVNVYRDDSCGVSNVQFTQSTGSICHPVTNARSIIVNSNKCTTKTWSGSNCAGSNFQVKDANCHSVLFASVSIVCVN